MTFEFAKYPDGTLGVFSNIGKKENGEEYIRFTNCVFDSPYTEINAQYTENINFVSNPQFHEYNYNIICPYLHYTNCINNYNTINKLHVLIILFFINTK